MCQLFSNIFQVKYFKKNLYIDLSFKLICKLRLTGVKKMQVDCDTKIKLKNLKYFCHTSKSVFFLGGKKHYFVDELSKETITF